jgi:hypothetical protein
MCLACLSSASIRRFLLFAAAALAAAASPAATPIAIAPLLFGMLQEQRTKYNVLIYFLFDLGLDRECAGVYSYIR